MCKCCEKTGQSEGTNKEDAMRILLKELGMEGNRSFDMHLCGFIAERSNSMSIEIRRTEEGRPLKMKYHSYTTI